jgi:hypothetical protein
MNDQPPQSGRPRHRPAPHPPSQESRFIGYVVLGFGALAVIAVLMLAFGGSNDVELTAEQTALGEELTRIEAPSEAEAQKPQQKLYLKRQKKIDADDMQGGWQAVIGDYLTVLQIQKGAFQIIMALPDPNRPRKYYSGTYRILDDLIVLKPEFKWGAPKRPPGSDITYTRLTASSFPMIVGFDKGNMVWQNAPRSETRVYVPPRSPLLSGTNMDYIIWKKMD